MRVLDWRSLHFDVLDEGRWLSLGKDLWKEIFLLVADQKNEKDNVGRINFLALWRLRATCRLFSKLIDPKFCMRLIYRNPFTNVCKYYCVGCSVVPKTCKRWYCRHQENPFYGGEESYKTKTYHFVHDPRSGVLQRRKGYQEKKIAASGPSTTQTNQTHYPEVVEQTFLNKSGRKLFGLKTIERQYWNKRNVDRKDWKEWRPRCKVDQKKSKWWKKNGNRKMIDRVDCDQSCFCEECFYDRFNVEEDRHHWSDEVLKTWYDSDSDNYEEESFYANGIDPSN